MNNSFFFFFVNPSLTPVSSSAGSDHFCEQLHMSAAGGRDSVFPFSKGKCLRGCEDWTVFEIISTKFQPAVFVWDKAKYQSGIKTIYNFFSETKQEMHQSKAVLEQHGKQELVTHFMKNRSSHYFSILCGLFCGPFSTQLSRHGI